MKKIMLLMTAILVISYLSSPPVLAASRSYESRTCVVLRIMYEQIFGLRVSNPHSRELLEIIADDLSGINLQGDADHLGGEASRSDFGPQPR